VERQVASGLAQPLALLEAQRVSALELEPRRRSLAGLVPPLAVWGLVSERLRPWRLPRLRQQSPERFLP